MPSSDVRNRIPENIFVAGCLVFAFLRLFLFSSAYPFFNARDEQLHYDMAVWNSGFHPGKGLHGFSPRSARNIVLYGSPEYLHTPGEYPGGKYPSPVFRLPESRQAREVREGMQYWTGQPNRLSLRPPLYYLLVSAWEKAGTLLGFRGGHLLYWLRFLNIPIYLGFMLIAVSFARWLPGADPLFRLGIPFMLAVFPQDVFYGINADVPSALLVGASFFLLAECTYNPARGHAFHALLGLAISASVMSKYTNIPLLSGMIAAYAPAIRAQWRRRGGPGKISLAGLVAILPVALWFARNILLTGEITGTASETKAAGIGMKPLSEWPFHPIFSLEGSWYFITETIMKFWRGGLFWGRERIADGYSDILYVTSTLSLLGIAWFSLYRKSKPSGREKAVAFGSLGTIAGGMVFLVVFSIALDDWVKSIPSMLPVGVTEGRFLLGALLPFTYLFLKGLGAASDFFGRGKNRRFAAMAVLFTAGALVVIGQVIVTIPIFRSEYNWFHLP